MLLRPLPCLVLACSSMLLWGDAPAAEPAGQEVPANSPEFIVSGHDEEGEV